MKNYLLLAAAVAAQNAIGGNAADCQLYKSDAISADVSGGFCDMYQGCIDANGATRYQGDGAVATVLPLDGNMVEVDLSCHGHQRFNASCNEDVISYGATEVDVIGDIKDLPSCADSTTTTMPSAPQSYYNMWIIFGSLAGVAVLGGGIASTVKLFRSNKTLASRAGNTQILGASAKSGYGTAGDLNQVLVEPVAEGASSAKTTQTF